MNAQLPVIIAEWLTRFFFILSWEKQIGGCASVL